VSTDGQYVASAARGEVITLWLWRLEDVISEACNRLSRNLTVEEWKQFFGGEPYRKTCARLPLHESLLYAALRLAREGDQPGFDAMVKRFEELEPKVDFTILRTMGTSIQAIGKGERDIGQARRLL